MTNPLITIIVPVYNAEKYLERCIQSILSQTFSDFELVLVDDGSTDNSPSMCDCYMERDNRVHVVHQTNAGVSAARNKGIDAAKGEFISFIDADDWVEREMYQTLYDEASRKEADYVYCGYYREKDGCSRPQEYVTFSPNNHLSNIRNHIDTWFIAVWSSIIRRIIVIQNKIKFNTRLAYNEDFNFMAKCLTAVQRISKVNQPLYHYNEDNVSSALHKKKLRQAEDEYISQIDVIDFYLKKHLYDDCKKELNYRLVRCIYFYKNFQRDKRYDKTITMKEIWECPYLGFRGKTYVTFYLHVHSLLGGIYPFMGDCPLP